MRDKPAANTDDPKSPSSLSSEKVPAPRIARWAAYPPCIGHSPHRKLAPGPKKPIPKPRARSGPAVPSFLEDISLYCPTEFDEKAKR